MTISIGLSWPSSSSSLHFQLPTTMTICVRALRPEVARYLLRGRTRKRAATKYCPLLRPTLEQVSSDAPLKSAAPNGSERPPAGSGRFRRGRWTERRRIGRFLGAFLGAFPASERSTAFRCCVGGGGGRIKWQSFSASLRIRLCARELDSTREVHLQGSNLAPKAPSRWSQVKSYVEFASAVRFGRPLGRTGARNLSLRHRRRRRWLAGGLGFESFALALNLNSVAGKCMAYASASESWSLLN